MTALKALADALQVKLLSHANSTGRSRASLTTLLSMQADIEAHASTRPGARVRLSTALTDLATQGVLEQPVAKHLWDHTAQPALPEWVNVIADIPGKGTPVDIGATTWVPIISRWIGEWLRTCRPSASARTALHKINSWLLDTLGEQPDAIAREERSLTIFGDEKILARIESSSIFAPGRLQPSDLAYERPTAPLRAARLADRGDLLIVENQSTFDSAWRALRNSPGPFAAVAFGNGWEAAHADPVTKLADHLQLKAAPERILYAGDLDIDGLDIPQTLAANMSTLSLPPPQPLTRAYEAMLKIAENRRGRPGAPTSDELAQRAATWLAKEHRDAAIAVLIQGRRIAQETLDRAWWTQETW